MIVFQCKVQICHSKFVSDVLRYNIVCTFQITQTRWLILYSYLWLRFCPSSVLVVLPVYLRVVDGPDLSEDFWGAHCMECIQGDYQQTEMIEMCHWLTGAVGCQVSPSQNLPLSHNTYKQANKYNDSVCSLG